MESVIDQVVMAQFQETIQKFHSIISDLVGNLSHCFNLLNKLGDVKLENHE